MGYNPQESLENTINSVRVQVRERGTSVLVPWLVGLPFFFTIPARTPRGPLESMRLWMTRRVRPGAFSAFFYMAWGGGEGSHSVFCTCFFRSPSIVNSIFPAFPDHSILFAGKHGPCKILKVTAQEIILYQPLRLMKGHKLIPTFEVVLRETKNIPWRNGGFSMTPAIF